VVRIAQDEAERQLLWAGRRTPLGQWDASMARSFISYVQDVVPRTKLPRYCIGSARNHIAYGLKVGNVFILAGDGNLTR